MKDGGCDGTLLHYAASTAGDRRPCKVCSSWWTKRERKAVVIDLSVHGELWEDFYDVALARARKDEPRESVEEVRRKVLGR